MEDNGTIGEIRMFAGNFAPPGWWLCEGQEMRIDSFTALYSIIGSNFGGDGMKIFRLPDMRGRLAVHPNDKLQLGRTGGSNTVLLEEKHLPPHTHAILTSKVKCSSVNTPAASRQSIPKDCYPGNTGSDFSYASAKFSGTAGTTKYFNASAITGNTSNSGLAEAMENKMPSLCISFMICAMGDYPARK
ncbi:MAG: tail fiber protein [Saprospiraceae bacterium]|nr:tail fiber protein [Saprospiraceae bacterium]